MRYVVLGIGAVGGTIAGRLSAAGLPVAALARGRHHDRVRDEGLVVATPDGVLRERIEVTDDPARLRLGPDDVLVLATKSQHSAGVLDALPPGATDLPLVCAQNGVANEREALRRFDRVHGMCVVVPALHTEPGKVAVFSRPTALLEVGLYPGGHDEVDERLAADFDAAGLDTRVRDDVMAWKHRKLLSNVGNAVEALTGTEHDEEARALVRELHRRASSEGERVLVAAGAPLLASDVWRERVTTMSTVDLEGEARGGGSTWQSLLRGAGSVEADYLNGEICLLGRLHGEPTPVNDLLRREVAVAAVERRPPGSVTPASLLARLDAA